MSDRAKPSKAEVGVFDPFAVRAGTTERRFVHVVDKANRTLTRYPVAVIAGVAAGPTAALIAGVHGDEFEGPSALWRLINETQPAEIAGRLVIVPIANLPAFEAGRRTTPDDELDLARVFPGRADGSVTSRLASSLFDRIVSRADIVVDCHSGGVRLAFAPVAGFYSAEGSVAALVAAKSLELAKALDLDWLWSLPHRPGVLSFEAASVGIPAIGIEVGGRGGLQRDDVEMCLLSLRKLLHAAGLLPKGPKPSSGRTTYLSGDWQPAPVEGSVRNHVSLGQRVAAGELVATIHGPFGEVVERLMAPVSGVVLGLRHLCSVSAGEGVMCVLKERALE